METKFLVNGKPMTNKEYIELMEKAREAQKAYKDTDAYKEEQAEKQKIEKELESNIAKFDKLGKDLKLSNVVMARIGLSLYNSYKPKKEE